MFKLHDASPADASAARSPQPPRRLERLVFLALVAFTYASITRGLVDGNSWSRMGLVFAIVERGELNIDPVVAARLTPDWSRSGGHFYSNKMPGPALLSTPFYFVQHAIQQALGVPSDSPASRDLAVYIANVVASILPTLIALMLLLRLFVERFGLSLWQAYMLCATWAVASLALPYSAVFFGHQSAAAFLAIGVSLSALEMQRAGGPRPSRLGVAALAMGMSVLCDLLVLASVGIWTVWLLGRARMSRRVIVAWVLGGAGPLLAGLVYNAACFGSPFVLPHTLGVLNPYFAADASWEFPSLGRLVEITVGPRRGLFYCVPVFGLILVGLDRLRSESRSRSEFAAAAAAVLLHLGVLASYPGAHGGFCVGPRYVTAVLPLALILLAPAIRMVPRLFASLAGLSAFLMLVATLADPLPDLKISDPFGSYLFPLLSSGGPGPMHNVFTDLIGLSLSGALWSYLALWSLALAWLWRRTHGALPGEEGGAYTPAQSRRWPASRR